MEFRNNWAFYTIQSFLATLVLFVILLCLQLQNSIVTASIGATAFIIFTMPDSPAANTRNVIGGHLLGLGFGSACALIPHSLWFHATLIYSLAVGLSIFSMVVLDMEHPPAAGTALGMAINGASWKISIALLASVVILSAAHKFCRPILRDIT